MDNSTFTVVTFDGKEHRDIGAETIKEWYLSRMLNADSMIRQDGGEWQMLRRAFDLDGWGERYRAMRVGEVEFAQASAPIGGALASEQLAPTHLPARMWQPPEPRETADDAPRYRQNYQRYEPPPQPTFAERQKYYTQPAAHAGMRMAAALLVINVFAYVLAVIIAASVGGKGDATMAYKIGEDTGISIVPLIFNLVCAYRLWNGKWRKFFLVLGVIAGLACALLGLLFFNPRIGNPLMGFLFLGYGISYVIALSCLLGGRGQPDTPRVMFGMMIFVLCIGLQTGVVFNLASMSENNLLASWQIRQYELPGREFTDVPTGANIKLPDGWKLIEPKNPVVSQPFAKMLAYNPKKDGYAMLEIVSATSGTEQISMPAVLDKFLQGMREKDGVAPVVVSKTYGWVGTKPADKLVMTDEKKGVQLKRSITMTKNRHNILILQLWCDTKKYDKLAPDFAAIEESFTLP